MAYTVNEAFDEFLKNTIRLDPDRTEVAKTSKSYLIGEILKFSDAEDFPLLHPQGTTDYGSFSRKTKIRPLDDIDLMVVLNAQGSIYNEYFDKIEITVNQQANRLLNLCHDNTFILNSRKVINRFKDSLGDISKYGKAEIKRNQEAATLSLSSYEWVFDIVPCFITNPNSAGTDFYLIPDGQGHWKKTDPRIDKGRTTTINSKQAVSVLDIIRLFKYWTSRSTMPTIKSYFLENLILNYYNAVDDSSKFVDLEIPKVLAYIYHNIHNSLNDPKGFQGDINHLTFEEREKIKNKAASDYHVAKAARDFEDKGKVEASINKWCEIFGEEFPTFG